jgi:peptide/nickel transport system permease protein
MSGAPATSDEKLPHFVRREPFDAYDGEKLDPKLESYYMATQWRLMWWKLRRHRLAVWSGVFLLLMYASIFVSEMVAPYASGTRNTEFV